MRVLFLLLPLALLVGCGSKSDGAPSDSGGGSSGQMEPVEGDLTDLDGLPQEEFIRAIVPRLSKDARIQAPADLAAALDQKWNIHCDQICRIKRK